jgi:putative FmdB family regulatory protein
MPIYEYRCEACGHTLEALQKINDTPLSDCPECSQSALKRLISAPSFRLKGSGWYETDFKSGKDKQRNLAETGGGESADKPKDSDKSSSDSKPKAADEKPAKKTEDKPKAGAEKKAGKGSEAA